MSFFTIDTENNIAVHATAKEAKKIAKAEQFQSEAALAKLAAKWPVARLMEILNSLPGEKPVKKVTDRKKAASRIWKAVQSLLGAPVAPQTPDVAPKATKASKGAAPAKKAPKAPTKATGTRTGSKTETVLGLLRREGGVTAAELMKATGWQAHSVRGFISGTVGKKLGLTVVSAKAENGERTYSIKA